MLACTAKQYRYPLDIDWIPEYDGREIINRRTRKTVRIVRQLWSAEREVT